MVAGATPVLLLLLLVVMAAGAATVALAALLLVADGKSCASILFPEDSESRSRWQPTKKLVV